MHNKCMQQDPNSVPQILVRYAHFTTICSTPFGPLMQALGEDRMKPRIEYEVHDIFGLRSLIGGRVIGSNIHVGDVFDSAHIQFRSTNGNIEKKLELPSNIYCVILEIEAFHKSVSWIHAPHSAALRINPDIYGVVSDLYNTHKDIDGLLVLSGPYSEKSDITGQGRW